MFNPAPATTVVVPIKTGPEAELGKAVTSDYFGEVPAGRLVVKDGVIYFSADGKYLWLSGRYDDVVYRIDTGGGAVDFIKVGKQPHGLTVWPQPGRYSLGHTGNLR